MCIILTFYFTAPTRSPSCADMHLFIGSRLSWEWNIATGSHVYEIVAFMGSAYINCGNM